MSKIKKPILEYMVLSVISVFVLMGADDCDAEQPVGNKRNINTPRGVQLYPVPKGKFKTIVILDDDTVCALKDNSNKPELTETGYVQKYDPEEGEVVCWHLSYKRTWEAPFDKHPILEKEEAEEETEESE